MYIWQVLCESSSFGGALVQLETMSEKTALVSHLQTTYESKSKFIIYSQHMKVSLLLIICSLCMKVSQFKSSAVSI